VLITEWRQQCAQGHRAVNRESGQSAAANRRWPSHPDSSCRAMCTPGAQRSTGNSVLVAGDSLARQPRPRADQCL